MTMLVDKEAKYGSYPACIRTNTSGEDCLYFFWYKGPHSPRKGKCLDVSRHKADSECLHPLSRKVRGIGSPQVIKQVEHKGKA